MDNGCIVHCASLEETRSEVQRITDFLIHNGRQKSNTHSDTGFHSVFTSIVFQAAKDSQIMKSFEIGLRQVAAGSAFIDVTKKLEDNPIH